MDQQLIEKVMRQVSDELGIKTEECKAESAPAECASQNIGMTEFVGTAMGDTIGLVIASVDPMLKDVMNLGKFRSIGIIGARTGAGPQIWAVDEAVKATNTEIISVELPRDTKGGAGHGSLIYIFAQVTQTTAVQRSPCTAELTVRYLILAQSTVQRKHFTSQKCM